jgi:hypothetical protein
MRWLYDVKGDLAMMGIKGWREMTRKKELRCTHLDI